jgi:hypothetical protein
MQIARSLSAAIIFVIVLSACVSLAPGADKVRITKNASDVSACSAVGNIHLPRDAKGNVDIYNADTEFRNQTVGLGGNTAFVTQSGVFVPVEGIAYRCP